MSENRRAQPGMESIDLVLQEVESVPDPAVRALFRKLVQALMEFHSSGLERILEIVYAAGESGPRTIDALGRDDQVRNLLLLYDLHPLNLQTRIAEALDALNSRLASQGANARLVQLTEAGVVTLRLEKDGSSRLSSTAALKPAIEQAIFEVAPDVSAVLIEGDLQEQIAAGTFIPLAKLQKEGNNSQGSAAERCLETHKV